MRAGRLVALGVLLAGTGAAAPPVAAPKFAFPLACTIGKTCEIQNYFDDDPGPGLRDYRCGRRTYNGHNGVDIRLQSLTAQRAGVDVLAAAPGRVARLRDGVADISIRAPGAPSVEGQMCGNGVVIAHGGGWESQYCHLAKGSVKVKVGDQVRTGQPIARVGLSGATEFPHLHITIRRGATNVDPFAPGLSGGGCQPRASLWTPAAAKAMSYKAGAVLNAGFAGQAISVEMLDAGAVAAPNSTSPYLTVYVRALSLQKGDVAELTIRAPDGSVLVSKRADPLLNDRAVEFMMIGKKRPAAGWARGAYTASYSVQRSGRTVLSRELRSAF